MTIETKQGAILRAEDIERASKRLQRELRNGNIEKCHDVIDGIVANLKDLRHFLSWYREESEV